jgi:CBS domain-containing protein
VTSVPGLREEAIVSRKVNDVMTVDVATASEHTPYKELVRLLGERRISALPVVDADQRVLGIVAEADLEGQHDHPARTAGELMSRPAITVGPEATVAEAVRLLRQHGVKRLPVTDPSGRLVGIVNGQTCWGCSCGRTRRSARRSSRRSSSAGSGWPWTGSR